MTTTTDPTELAITRAIATAQRYFGLELSNDTARKIIAWDDEREFVDELEDDGTLDNAPLDYFSMALLDQVMPGKPTVQDGLISCPLERWHFPLNGSSEDYKRAFTKEWRKLTKNLRHRRKT